MHLISRYFITYVKFTSILLFAFLSIGMINAQTSYRSNAADFKIIILNTDKGIEMTSSEGSAWKKLSFNLKYGKKQAVNAYGMTTIDDNADNVDTNLSNYLFTIEKGEGNLVILNGIRGTSWISLSFNSLSPQSWTLDRNGISSN